MWNKGTDQQPICLNLSLYFLPRMLERARPVWRLVPWYFNLGNNKKRTNMDTCFPLLQPKHHCVRVTGERPWETNQSQEWEQKVGVELDRKIAGDGGAGGWWRTEGAAAQTQRWGEGEELSLSAQRSWTGEAAGGSRRGETLSSCPARLWTRTGLQAVRSLQKPRKTEKRWLAEKCLPVWLNRTSSVTWRAGKAGETKRIQLLKQFNVATF